VKIDSHQQHHHDDEKKEEMLKFSDEIHQLIVSKYQELIDTITKSNSGIKQVVDLNEIKLSKFLNVYASIVQTDELDAKTAKLICFTTGTKCISGEYMSMNGTALNDWYKKITKNFSCYIYYYFMFLSHAEILAVRLLRKYLYKQLKEYMKHLSEHSESENNLEGNIFELNKIDSDSTTPNPNQKPFRLKSHVKFHLFISSAPCGDGRIFSISDKSSHHHSHIDK
jgi:double stranded RNA-specific editase B